MRMKTKTIVGWVAATPMMLFAAMLVIGIATAIIEAILDMGVITFLSLSIGAFMGLGAFLVIKRVLDRFI